LSTTISKDGTVIGYDKIGSGPAIILVAGATQYRGTDQQTPEFARLLSSDLTVINYDRRGRGESGDTQPYAVAREIEDIAALIEVAGGRASLFGGSSGCALSLEAAQAGLAIDKLVLYEPPFVVDDSWTPPPRDYLEKLAGFRKAGDKAGALTYFFTASIHMPPDQVEAMKQSPFWPMLEPVGQTIEYDALCMGKEAIEGGLAKTQRWNKVEQPVLVVNGDASFPFMPAAADVVAKVLKNASRKTLPGQGHGPAPEVIAPVVLEFLQRAD
jgi:pimeloyl-ACP methyl ester carboxylesterase